MGEEERKGIVRVIADPTCRLIWYKQHSAAKSKVCHNRWVNRQTDRQTDTRTHTRRDTHGETDTHTHMNTHADMDGQIDRDTSES